MTISTVNSEALPPAIFLMGPTASGKTDLALALTERLPCDIISVDSALVYRGMNIGTAKPEADVLKRFPHRLIDILDPAESYSAAQFRQDALREMQAITAAGRIPLLVGGTMLYFRALTEGLSVLPPADREVRCRLEEEAKNKGQQWMHHRLTKVDPASAARIHPNDPQRLQRALEVYEITGKSMSELIAKPGERLMYQPLKLILAPGDRDFLRERIAIRFRQMLAQGFVAEVEGLYQRGDLTSDLPSIRCVGYRQVWEYLEGEMDAASMEERAIIATRQLAKRQFTWLRKEEGAHWLDSQDEHVLVRALKYLEPATTMYLV